MEGVNIKTIQMLPSRFAVVRLVGGGGPSRGRVEVFYRGTWGTVCDNGWDLTDAKVVCRELGFPGAVKVFYAATFGEGDGPIWMDRTQCTGNESSLTECRHRRSGQGNCGHNKDAGVMCSSGNKNSNQIFL